MDTDIRKRSYTVRAGLGGRTWGGTLGTSGRTMSSFTTITTYCAAADNISALARADTELRARSAKVGAAGQDDELRQRVEINGIVCAMVAGPELKCLRVCLIETAPLKGRKLWRRLAIG